MHLIKTLYIAYTIFQNFNIPHSHTHAYTPTFQYPHSLFVLLFLWLSMWLHHIWCVILLNDIMDTLVPLYHKGISVCFMQQDLSLLRSNTWHGSSTLIWHYTQTDKKHNTHRGAIDWHTHISIYQLLCAHNSYLYYISWIIHWYQNFTLQSSIMSLLLENCQLVEVTYLLIIFNKTRFFPWNMV